MRQLLFNLTIIVLLLLSLPTKGSEEQIVVLISLDGFRWDYIEKHGAKNIANIAKQGVRGHKMRPVYPTKTFPNHISMVTGLLPINHGVVENRFCDTKRSDCYSMGKGKVNYLGTHGYAYNEDMAATFVSQDPAFKQKMRLKEVNNLDTYPLIANVLGLKILSDGQTLFPDLAEQ